jgi:hypothetical protein
MELKQEQKTVYVSKIIKKRFKESDKKSDDRHFIIYDLDKFDIMQEIARRERSNVSSIINNLYEEFLTKFDSPQTTIEVFQSEKKTPSINADPILWRKYLKSLSKEEYNILDKYFNTILFLHNQRGKEL